jgi:hypothetical protein
MFDIDALLSAIRAAPDLTGARCTGRSQLFDEQPHTAKGELNERRAIRCCRHCPVLAACATWLAALPPNQRPPGVIAGQIVVAAPKREPHKPPTSRLRAAALRAVAEHQRVMARSAR